MRSSPSFRIGWREEVVVEVHPPAQIALAWLLGKPGVTEPRSRQGVTVGAPAD
jgi:hypothetical protein